MVWKSKRNSIDGWETSVSVRETGGRCFAPPNTTCDFSTRLETWACHAYSMATRRQWLRANTIKTGHFDMCAFDGIAAEEGVWGVHRCARYQIQRQYGGDLADRSRGEVIRCLVWRL